MTYESVPETPPQVEVTVLNVKSVRTVAFFLDLVEALGAGPDHPVEVSGVDRSIGLRIAVEDISYDNVTRRHSS